MNFLNVVARGSADGLKKFMQNNELVNDGVVFNEKYGTPRMSFRWGSDDTGRFRMKCEMTGRATKDNAFLVGTVFYGRISEHDGEVTLRGFSVTSPLYHLCLIALLVFFVIRCIAVGGFSVVPLCLFVFSMAMFIPEFRKQGYMKRYLMRAVRRYSENVKD